MTATKKRNLNMLLNRNKLKMAVSKTNRYSPQEEKANYITHGTGLLLSIIGTILLIILAGQYGSKANIISFSCYGVSLIVLYLSSTLYHLTKNHEIKAKFRKMDHCAIFLLIAGTYTALISTIMGGAVAFSIIAGNWILATLGIMVEFLPKFRAKKAISIFLYIFMGWSAIFIIKPIFLNTSHISLALIILGGVFYTGGLPLYLIRKIPYNHAIWHFLCLSGSLLHYFAILMVFIEKHIF